MLSSFCGALRPGSIRRLSLGLASAGFVLGGASAALASAGCDAVNAGGFNRALVGIGQTTNAPISGFAAGDKIDFSINILSGSANSSQWWVIAGGNVLMDETGAPGVYPHSYTVTGTGDLSMTSTIRVQGGGGDINVTATCTAGPSASAPNTDGQKLRAVQTQGSSAAAQTSGLAITDAVSGAIGNAFAGTGSPVTVGPNGVAFNFAADPREGVASRSADARRADAAFSALAYAGHATKAPRKPAFEQPWSAWADVRGTGFDQSGSLGGRQLNATAGIGYKLTPDVLIGVLGGYENFRYDFTALSGTLKGSGGTVGAYAAWRIVPTLRWDAMVGWSGIAYDGSAATASGSFTGSRLLASTGLSGTYGVANVIVEPSAKIFALWEAQNAWTDSIGTAQQVRRFSAGRVAVGGRVIAPWQISAAYALAPYAGLYGDWRFASDTALPAGQPVVGIGKGWSGRITGGVSLARLAGGSLTLGGELGGLGADYKVWTANAVASWPF